MAGLGPGIEWRAKGQDRAQIVGHGWIAIGSIVRHTVAQLLHAGV